MLTRARFEFLAIITKLFVDQILDSLRMRDLWALVDDFECTLLDSTFTLFPRQILIKRLRGMSNFGVLGVGVSAVRMNNPFLGSFVDVFPRLLLYFTTYDGRGRDSLVPWMERKSDSH